MKIKIVTNGLKLDVGFTDAGSASTGIATLKFESNGTIQEEEYNPEEYNAAIAMHKETMKELPNFLRECGQAMFDLCNSGCDTVISVKQKIETEENKDRKRKDERQFAKNNYVIKFTEVQNQVTAGDLTAKEAEQILAEYEERIKAC